MDGILGEIKHERFRQDCLWGAKRTLSVDKQLVIIVEEIGEVARAIFDHHSDNLREELVQVAACAVQFIESLDDGRATGL